MKKIIINSCALFFIFSTTQAISFRELPAEIRWPITGVCLVSKSVFWLVCVPKNIIVAFKNLKKSKVNKVPEAPKNIINNSTTTPDQPKQERESLLNAVQRIASSRVPERLQMPVQLGMKCIFFIPNEFKNLVVSIKKAEDAGEKQGELLKKLEQLEKNSEEKGKVILITLQEAQENDKKSNQQAEQLKKKFKEFDGAIASRFENILRNVCEKLQKNEKEVNKEFSNLSNAKISLLEQQNKNLAQNQDEFEKLNRQLNEGNNSIDALDKKARKIEELTELCVKNQYVMNSNNGSSSLVPDINNMD